VALHNFVPAARNGRVEQAERDQRASNHDRSLNQIGPNDRLNPTESCVNGREYDDRNRGTDVDPESLSLVWPSAADHFVGKRECYGCHIQPRSGREQTRNHENGGSRIFTRDPEARGQVFVDRENFVVVIRFDENVADENAPDDRAEGELQVGVVAVAEAFPRRSEKCTGACFSRDQ
jgi:hypothetical protein